MADNKLNDIIETSLENIRSIADAGTIIGEPINTNNGTLVIPVSKISLGFASGGVDYLSKDEKDKQSKNSPASSNAQPSQKQNNSGSRNLCFGGGGGTGLTVTPICFLIVKADGNVELLNIANPAAVPPAVGIVDSVSSFIEKSPDIISKLKETFKKTKTVTDLDDETLKSEIEKDAEK